MAKFELVGVYRIPQDGEVGGIDRELLVRKPELLDSIVLAEFSVTEFDDTSLPILDFEQERNNPWGRNAFDWLYLDEAGANPLGGQGDALPCKARNFRFLVYLRNFQFGEPIQSPFGEFETTSETAFPERLNGLFYYPDFGYD